MQNHLSCSVQTVMSIEDLLMEILVRLPGASIIRFKLVTKIWYSVITSRAFLLCYTRKPTSTLGILFPYYEYETDDTYEFAPISVDSPANPPFKKLGLIDDPSIGIHIEQSCNGLLLCSSLKLIPSNSDAYQNDVHVHKPSYYICNPTTKRFLTLPQGQEINNSLRTYTCGMNLAFDPAKSCDHYKVVHVWMSLLDEPLFHIEVYSSETGCWRTSEEVFKVGVDFVRDGVYWNDAIHWICNRFTVGRYFRADDETMHLMPMPPIPAHVPFLDTRRLLESCDHLHLFQYDSDSVMICIKLYEMTRDRSKWFVKYVVNFIDFVKSIFRMPVVLLTIVRSRQAQGDDDAGLFFVNMGNVIRYDLVKNTYAVCYKVDGSTNWGAIESDSRYPAFRGFQFVESLCPI